MRNAAKLTHTVRKNHEPFAQGWYYGHYQEALWHKNSYHTTYMSSLWYNERLQKKKKKRKERVISFYPECFIASSVSG